MGGFGAGDGGWGGGHFGAGKGPGSQHWAAGEMKKAAADMLRERGIKVPIDEEEIEMRIGLTICGIIVGAVIGWWACMNFGPDDPCPVAASNPQGEPNG